MREVEMMTRRTVAPPEQRPIVKIREVPLNYNGDKSTLLLTFGATPARVILETAVHGREVRAWCKATKAWNVDGATLVVTNLQGRSTRHEPGEADVLVIAPTVRQLEWTRQAGSKG